MNNDADLIEPTIDSIGRLHKQMSQVEFWPTMELAQN